MRTVRNLINGEPQDALSGATSELIDSSTGKVFGTAPLSGAEDVDAAYQAAAAAVPQWAGITPAERQRLLLRFADLVEARADDLVAAESQNTGKPLELTRTEEHAVMVDQLRFFAGAARLLEGKSAGEYLAGHTSWIRREPIGVVGQISPWNYPMKMADWKIGPALAAGNTLVLKPAETTPVTTVMLAAIAAEVLPAGAFNVGCGDRETGQAVVALPCPAWSASPDRPGPARKSRVRRLSISSAPTWNSAARRRPSSSPTPISTPRQKPSGSAGTSMPARTVRRPAACSSTPRSTTSSSGPSSPGRLTMLVQDCLTTEMHFSGR